MNTSIVFVIAGRVVAPDLLEQALARDDQALVAHQELEQLELAVGQVDLALAARHLAGLRVEAEVADDQRGAARGGRRRSRARMRASSSGRSNGLTDSRRHRRRGPSTRSSVSVRAVRIRIGTSRLRPQPAADLDAVEPGEPEVEDDQVGDELARRPQRLLAVGGGAHLVALLAQRPAQDVGDLLVVLDDEDASDQLSASLTASILKTVPAAVHRRRRRSFSAV